jgi:large subunit ribosomal protein L7/L12
MIRKEAIYMEKLMISEILDSIRGLTVRELLELTKACEKEFGVSAAVTPILPKDPIPPKKKTEFDVELTNFGSQKVKVIKAIREITGLGLREAKEFVEAAPKIIKEGVSIEEAEALKAKFQELGAAITLK